MTDLTRPQGEQGETANTGSTGATGASGQDGKDGENADPTLTYGAISIGILGVLNATYAVMRHQS